MNGGPDGVATEEDPSHWQFADPKLDFSITLLFWLIVVNPQHLPLLGPVIPQLLPSS